MTSATENQRGKLISVRMMKPLPPKKSQKMRAYPLPKHHPLDQPRSKLYIA